MWTHTEHFPKPLPPSPPPTPIKSWLRYSFDFKHKKKEYEPLYKDKGFKFVIAITKSQRISNAKIKSLHPLVDQIFPSIRKISLLSESGNSLVFVDVSSFENKYRQTCDASRCN